MSIDPKKIRKVYAKPPEPVHFGVRELSVLTQALVDLEVDQSLLIPTGGGNEHKIAQRNVNARVKFIRKVHTERQYVTRTLKPGDVLPTFTAAGTKSRNPETIQEVILGIFRTR